MENIVFLAVLFAALCHAGWNALIKVGLDPLSATTLISIGSGLVALLFLPLVGVPASPAWPWLIASVVIHLFYFAALIEAYRSRRPWPGLSDRPRFGATDDGDGNDIPRRRKIEPDRLGSESSLLVAGVFLLSARGGRELTKFDRRSVGFALLTALTICTYSVVDGIGARLAANPNAYSLWLFVGIAVVMLPYALYRDGRDVIPAMRTLSGGVVLSAAPCRCCLTARCCGR